MAREINEKEMRRHLRDRLENITSPVAYQIGMESLDSIYYKLHELVILAETFGIYGYEYEQLKIARQKYEEKIIERSKRR